MESLIPSTRSLRRGYNRDAEREKYNEKYRSAMRSGRSSLKVDAGVEVDDVIDERRRDSKGNLTTVRNYRKGRLLGKGGFAWCFLVRCLSTDTEYAAKIVNKATLVKPRSRQKLQTEIKIHRTLRHPHIVRFERFFDDHRNAYILLELCANGSLSDMVQRRKRLTEREMQRIMLQLVDGVKYMHLMGVIHRDIKLGNIFLDSSMNVKIGDLGLAAQVSSSSEQRKTVCGTPNYIAPEVLSSRVGHSFQVDVWSLGVVLYTALVGRPPYASRDVKSTYKKILANMYSFPHDLDISDGAKDLIGQMLQTQPHRRPTLDQIIAHEFFTQAPGRIPAELPSSARNRTPNFDAAGNYIFSPPGSRDRGGRGNAKAAKTQARRPLGDLLPSRGIKTVMPFPKVQALGQSEGPGFQVYDENIHPKSENVARGRKKPSSAVSSRPRGEPERPTGDLLSGRRSSSASSSTCWPDCRTFEVVHKALERSLRPEGEALFRPDFDPAATLEEPSHWVSRYVDYTSKYGLGFLLNSGAGGVYFNDSTKIVMHPKGSRFAYVERRRSSGGAEHVVKYHNLNDYPAELHKKVTLLRHFQTYLLEEDESEIADENTRRDGPVDNLGNEVSDDDLVFLKKWIRTRHAILFKLSNRTVQVIFFDKSEILLSNSAETVTYVPKHGRRQTSSLGMVMRQGRTDVTKRLKYAKDILAQLIACGGTHSTKPKTKSEIHSEKH